MSDTKKQPKIDINEVIQKALETLGLNIQSLQEMVGDRVIFGQTSDGKLKLSYKYGIDLVIVLKLLYLDSSHLSEGYDQEKHLGAICGPINRKEFQYKKGKLVKTAWKRFKQNRWESEGKLCCFKLRWQIRFRRWLGFYNSGKELLRKSDTG